MDSARVTFGVDEWNRSLTHDFAKTASHLSITGLTRSGKTALAYVLLGNLSQMPHVRVVGSDPSSLLLAPFRQRGEKQVALGGDAAEHVKVLEWCVGVMQERLKWLLEHGIDKLTAFTPERPLLIVFMEEELMLSQMAKAQDASSSPKGKNEARIKALLLELLAGGAKCGIRVVVSMQRPDAEILGGPARSQIAARFVLKSDAEGIRMVLPGLDERNKALLADARPGVGVYSVPGKPPTAFRGKDLSYHKYVEAVLAHGV
ncbi:FtsK/SpoIIIE domain-containing protein [Bifidobacterium sp. ESL0682]|uniref:FtsK/SpoIIIE domain-containing protein n=1 Tax=Bifidobacterium sp. ESL0682 TaxID=2983212 RepID=UPI0023F8DE42|nr:FtsK/SpoIIIE domain-containing protein [Bifidobacterium sp. ESL0682]WEV42313.1 FtsK/SpoIIIE domain-containing protein [Bifidobacterium sp. ESL0682]